MPPILVVLALLAGGTWVFVELAEEVGEEAGGLTFDERVLLALRTPEDRSDPLGPPWVERLMRDITALGGVGVLTLFVLAIIGYLLLTDRARAALFLAVAVGGGMLLALGLKALVDRPRPDIVPGVEPIYTASFPSGHSMMSAVVYLTLAALLARTQDRTRVRAYLLGLATLLALLVGLSRVYLAVHWPTDVLAGWTAGAVWALLSWTVMRYLQRRGITEEPGDDEPGADRGSA